MSLTRSKPPADWDTHEHLLAGLRGWHMALCASALGNGSGDYLGYFKICAEVPANYWEAKCLIKCCTDVPRSTPREALRDAEDQARLTVYNLPLPRTLQAVVQGRHLNIYELHRYGGRANQRW